MYIYIYNVLGDFIQTPGIYGRVGNEKEMTDEKDINDSRLG